MKLKKRVAVIGAGAAGLCAARHAVVAKCVDEVVIYEQTTRVGGIWVYTDEVGADLNGLPIHSSMYRNMKTNLPKEVMGFPDFPFPEEHRSFIHHSHVLRYMQLYAEHFELEQYIKFEEVVKSVTPLEESDEHDECWEVKSMNLNSDEISTELFDAVFVCNGHFSTPVSPSIEGAETFPGRTLHSHDYRSCEPFANQRVICLGCGPSGIDISFEIAAAADQVYLCHEKKVFECPVPANLQQKRGIRRIDGANVELEDGEVLKNISTIIYCTGYRYSFPFLKSVALSTKGNRVTPMYQHMVHVDHPTSLFFIGLPFTLPFPCFDVQVRYALALLAGRVQPPDRQEMINWERKEFNQRTVEAGKRVKFAHNLGPSQRDYLQELARLGSFANPIKPVVNDLYDLVHHWRSFDLVAFKELRFQLIDDTTFTELGYCTS